MTSAFDLARKLLVLARECGFALEPAQDARWRERVAAAERVGERWVVLAEVDASGGCIVPQGVAATSSARRANWPGDRADPAGLACDTRCAGAPHVSVSNWRSVRR